MDLIIERTVVLRLIPGHAVVLTVSSGFFFTGRNLAQLIYDDLQEG